MVKVKYGTDFKSTNLDMLIAGITAVGLPFLCHFLYQRSGALLPILVYYLVFCVGLVKWRKGSLDYRFPKNLVSVLFVILLILQIAHFLVSNQIAIPVKDFSLAGFLLTLFIWCPVNGFMEQLLWIYIYDAFANRSDNKNLKILFSGLGIVFYWTFIALIHIFFWIEFLMKFNTTPPYFAIFMVLQCPLTIGYLIIYRKTKSMWPIAILHILQDMGGVLLTKYSILPYLFK